MKTIQIPSVASEKCNTIIEFDDDSFKGISWSTYLKCTTPSFTGEIKCLLEADYVKEFIEDLTIVEKERKGQCQLGYQFESAFSLAICSVDSVGHFVFELTIQDNRNSLGYNQIDSLKIAYEIEPSSLIFLLKSFQDL